MAEGHRGAARHSRVLAAREHAGILKNKGII